MNRFQRISAFGSVLVSLFLVGGCGQGSNDSAGSTTKMLEKIDAENEAAREKQRKQIEEQGYAEADYESMGRVGEQLASAAENATGHDQTLLNVMSKFVMDFQRYGKDFQVAVDEFIQGGGLTLEPEISKEELQGRRDRIRAMGEATEVFSGQIASCIDDLRTKLTEAGLPREIVAANVSQFAIEFKQPILLEIRDADRVFSRIGQESLQILLDHFELMKVNSDGTVTFDDTVPDQVVDRYYETLAEIQQQAERQVALQKKYLDS